MYRERQSSICLSLKVVLMHSYLFDVILITRYLYFFKVFIRFKEIHLYLSMTFLVFVIHVIYTFQRKKKIFIIRTYAHVLTIVKIK